jgi:hypothetical protein
LLQKCNHLSHHYHQTMSHCLYIQRLASQNNNIHHFHPVEQACIHPSDNHLSVVVCTSKAEAVRRYHQYFGILYQMN